MPACPRLAAAAAAKLLQSCPTLCDPIVGCHCLLRLHQLFPGNSVGKESACSAGDPGSVPASGRSPGEGNGKPLQYPCLENPLDRGAWLAAVHGVTKSWVRLSNYQCQYLN